MSTPAIGFDLDMTLIDSRPGIKAVWDVLAAESGTSIDTDLVVSRLGPPLEHELASWFPAGDVAGMADRYRTIYADIAVALVQELPGAAVALRAAASQGRTLVITAKNSADAARHLDHLGIHVDRVHGSAWREGKADVLRAEGAQHYVGDHVHDMEAAQLANVIGVGVTTGPCSADELQSAGAHVVLDSLEEFPAWLNSVAV